SRISSPFRHNSASWCEAAWKGPEAAAARHRRVLVRAARSRTARKRGGCGLRIQWNEAIDCAPMKSADRHENRVPGRLSGSRVVDTLTSLSGIHADTPEQVGKAFIASHGVEPRVGLQPAREPNGSSTIGFF